MASKLDVAFYAFLFGGTLVGYFMLLGLNLSLTVAAITVLLVQAIAYCYDAYWAFGIVRALVTRACRRQARWLGALAVYFAGFWLLIALIDPRYPYGSGPLCSVLDFYNDFGYLAIFAWMDATVRLTRLSDPLLRQPLASEKLRLILWPLVLLGLGYFVAEGRSLFFSDLFSTLPYPAIVIGALALLVGTRRTKDLILRRHLRWLGFATFLLVLVEIFGHFSSTLGFLPASSSAYLAVIDGILILFGGFPLFKSSKSLAPLNRILVDQAG